MAEVTDLHILAVMSEGTPNEEDAFNIRDENGKILYQAHNLEELVEILSSISSDLLFPYLCRFDEADAEFECDLALWVHYVLGDATLSAKIFHYVDELSKDPAKLKLELFNLCFNRYLNFLEILEQSNYLFEEETFEPTDI